MSESTISGADTSSYVVPPAGGKARRWWLRGIGALLLALAVLIVVLMYWWSDEPVAVDVRKQAQARAQERGEQLVPGYITTATASHLGEFLLDKPGGYLANDIAPPGVLMDNMPAFEFGVVLQLRDLALALRNDFSRSQSQSVEDPDLREALNMFSSENRKWIFPSTESRFREGVQRLDGYLGRLSDDNDQDGQFYARADNLEAYLGLVEKRLGSLSQRLSASIGQERINTDLAGDANAQQSTPSAGAREVRTPWLQIDNVFYEARGTTYALIHILKAIEHDFRPVLEDKNAVISLRQIIRELEESQAPIYSPIILNGGGYGFFANHSLVMANYISRANAALIDLRKLLERG